MTLSGLWQGLRRRLRATIGTPRSDTGTDSDTSSDVTTVTVAATAGRCAALLRGGMQGTQLATALLREMNGDEADKIAAQLAEGAQLGDSFAAVGTPEWRILGTAWNLAEVSGAPFAPVLDRIAHALDTISELSRRRAVLLAGPRMTVKLIAWLPLAAIGVGFVLGFDPLPVFLTPFGAVLLGTGLTMQFIGVRWAHRLAARVEAADRVAGLECELVWIALAGGAPPEHAIPRVADAITHTGAEWVEYQSLCRGQALDRALGEATRSGVPAASLLLSAAAEARNRTQVELEREAERLSIRILIPLAVCVLPAFIVLGVVPVIITLLGGLITG